MGVGGRWSFALTLTLQLVNDGRFEVVLEACCSCLLFVLVCMCECVRVTGLWRNSHKAIYAPLVCFEMKLLKLCGVSWIIRRGLLFRPRDWGHVSKDFFRNEFGFHSLFKR